MGSLVDLQAVYNAALFKLEATKQSIQNLDKDIALALDEIHNKPDIREHEHQVAESRSGSNGFFTRTQHRPPLHLGLALPPAGCCNVYYKAVGFGTSSSAAKPMRGQLVHGVR